MLDDNINSILIDAYGHQQLDVAKEICYLLAEKLRTCEFTISENTDHKQIELILCEALEDGKGIK